MSPGIEWWSGRGAREPSTKSGGTAAAIRDHLPDGSLNHEVRLALVSLGSCACHGNFENLHRSSSTDCPCSTCSFIFPSEF